ncbi:MAG TPA: hypothetical protein VN699_07490 [Pirellulales bacterium]|nr:hypothetical protein [Pirellulales bacterium]
MNRTLALSAIFLVAVGGAVAARHAAAQGLSDAPPADRSGGAFADDLDAGAQPASGALPVDAAKEQYQKAVRHASDVLTGLLIQHSKDAPGDQANDRRALRDKLRPLVEETFDSRQRLQQAELKELRRRLAEIEQAIQEREKNKEVIVNSRVDELLDSNSAETGIPNFDVRNNETGQPVGKLSPSRAPSRQVSEKAIDERNDATSADGEFDFDTRERLAQLDVQAAQEECSAAERDLLRLEELFKKGAARESDIQSKEKELRRAKRELQRAEFMLEGLSGRRAELSAAAEADVAEAEAEVARAAAKVDVAKATAEAAKAQTQKVEADIEAAKANYAFRQKTHDRMQKLFETKSIDSQTLDEAEKQFATAKAAFDGARSTLATSKANIMQANSAIAEAQAEKNVAEQRLRAAQLHFDRFIHGLKLDRSKP